VTAPGSESPRFVSEVLDPARHIVDPFRCGEPGLDDWLRLHAAHAARMDTARTFVWCDRGGADQDMVRAYYALSAHLLASTEVPAKIARGGPRHLPAVLLAKLALSVELRGRGLGVQLLVDALRRVVAASQQGPAVRVVIVDAITAAAAQFYQRFGFVPVPGNATRLVQKMSVIQAVPGIRPR